MLNGRGNLQKAFPKFSDNVRITSSELGSVPDKNARWPLGLPPGGHFFNQNTPLHHSYHSRRVIARSASRKRYTDKWRTLARATSGSLTTRIPDDRESRYGVTSNTRTYRRVEVAALNQNELRKNRGSKLKRPKNRVKAASVYESRKNSFLMMDKFFKSDYKPKRKTVKGWKATAPVETTVKRKGQEAKSGYRPPKIKWDSKNG